MNIELSYQTQNIPAPYAYSVVCSFKIANEQIEVDFNLTYLDRDEVSEDEIRAEGFSENDDFKWKGCLGPNWEEPIQELLRVNYQSDPKNEFYLHVITDKKELGFPNISDDLMIQELIQAVYESAQEEAPLQIEYYNEGKKGSLLWEFAKRKVTINNTEIAWEEGKTIMQALYSVEMENPKISKKPVNQSISFDGNSWIAFDVSQFWNSLSEVENRPGK